MTLAVTLAKSQIIVGDIAGGILYCIALSNGSVPSSIGSIKSATSDGSSSIGASTTMPSSSSFPLKLTVLFTGMNSIQTYAIFCYVETSGGIGNPLSAVLLTKKVMTTACCKSLTFSNSPSYVYGDLSKYTSSSSSLYVFTYYLSAAPTSSVKVMPLMYFGGILDTSVVATPSTTVFTSTSLLTGQFFLSASSGISGAYTIVLTVSGSNSAQYSNTSDPVQILSSKSLVPAPVMTSSQFSNSGQAVIITFDTPSDSAGIATTTWACSSLFVFINAESTTCKWVDAATVSVAFGVVTSASNNVAYLTTGNNVTLIGGKLRSFCTGTVATCALNTAANAMTVITLAPQNPSSPTVVLSAPLYLGSCANLSLDATGSYGNGGRLYTSVIWTVSALQSSVVLDVSAIQLYLNRLSAAYQVYRPLNVASSRLTKGTYTFTLRLTNFLGLSASKSISVVVSSDPNVPSLAIIGPSYRTIVTASALSILSAATLSSCASQSNSVVYSWSVQLAGASVSIVSASLDPSRFSISSYVLAVDRTYVITITASAGSSTTSASVTVYVALGTVTAAVVGGYLRSTPVDKVLVLDASISSDADESPTVASTLEYKVTV